jgi:transcriptional regulator with AAA-type ATPase domain
MQATSGEATIHVGRDDRMTLFEPSERRLAQIVAELVYCNPFVPERIELERLVLGKDFIRQNADWNLRRDVESLHPNVELILARAEGLVTTLRQRVARGAALSRSDAELHEDMVIFILYHRYRQHLHDAVTRELRPGGRRERIGFYKAFVRDLRDLLSVAGGHVEPAHLLACFFQVRRAFFHIFSNIVGTSVPVARLRARVWQSIFTFDERRYRRALFGCMGDLACLVTGPSGTGKELVARAIGLSRYVPFDPATETFKEDVNGCFFALNLPALSPTLVESELFGHCKGAFTGALRDRMGWLEICPPLGTVFLDEIGEIEPAIQVKLLRVLESRTFQRLGDTADRRFNGKIIAASNRDLGLEMKRGTFREDLYYRLCSDQIATPTLRERLEDCPEELGHLLGFIARRLVGHGEAEALAREVETWVLAHLGCDYPWPGNVRELEQCFRNVMVRKEYVPARREEAAAGLESFGGDVLAGHLSVEELLRRYVSLQYARLGSYQAVARRLKLDHRTVKNRVDRSWVEKFAGGSDISAVRESDRLARPPIP